MELRDLSGMRKFSGFDRETKAVKRKYSDNYDDCEVVSFILDGVTYEATEDVNDGYRSSMRDLSVVKGLVKNFFDTIDVFCIHRTKGLSYGEDDVLEFRNMRGDLFLEIGTSNIDDYYPYFVCNYTPELMR